jgi:hypothetical protein
VADDYRIIGRPWSSPQQAATGSSVRSPHTRCGWVVLPSLLIGVPAAFRKQAVDIGQRAVATNEEPQPFGVRLARPAPVSRFATGIVRIEPDAPQRLPAAMRISVPRHTRPCASHRWAHHSRDRCRASSCSLASSRSHVQDVVARRRVNDPLATDFQWNIAPRAAANPIFVVAQ